MSRFLKVILGLVALTLLTVVVGLIALFVGARTTDPPPAVGARDGSLSDCPGTPNCVSTQASDPQFAMEPLRYSGTQADAHTRLVRLVSGLPRTEVLAAEPDYIHVVVRSATFGFPDDIEFYFPPDEQIIQYRAAARLGQSDLGVNHARMQTIAQQFAAQEASPE